MQQSLYSDKYSSFSSVAAQSISARKLMEEVCEIFEERANLEDRYCKALEKLVNQLNRLEDKNPMFKVPIYCLKSIYASRMHQAEGFHKSLKDDLLIQLKNTIVTSNVAAKKQIEEGKKYEKDLIALGQDVKKNLQDYKQKKREYEQHATVMVVYNLLSEYSEKKRISQYYKVDTIQKELAIVERKYKEAINQNNACCETNTKKISALLEQLEQQEDQRLNIFKESLMRQIIFEVSHAKNIQYDLDKITEKLDEIVPQQELQKFSNSLKPEVNFEIQEFQPLNSYISSSLSKFFNKEYDDLLQLNSDQKLIESIREIWKGSNVEAEEPVTQKAIQIAQIIQTIWTEQISIEDVNKFITDLNDPLTKKLFLVCLQIKRTNQEFQLTSVTYDNLVNILRNLLDQCITTFDSGTARRIMMLLFTFFKFREAEVKDKIYYLQNELMGHKIWETRDFWETCIIQSIYESLKEEQSKNKQISQSEQIVQEKNIILKILTQISQNMLLFNFKMEPLKDIMRKFSAFFELNEEISNDLFNAISGFERAKLEMLQKQPQEKELVEEPKQETNLVDKFNSFVQQLKE